MIKVITIDDEPLALKVLKEHASKVNFIHLEKSFTNPLEGFEYLQQAPVSALFLDIKIHDISGIDLAELMPSDMHIIFTTAYPDYAVKGFELCAIDYLLKPITFTRFFTSLP